MSKNVTLWGASYSDVPSIEVPSTGGGVAAFHDVSDTTAVAEDVATGKYFHAADGTLTEGTSSGGGGQAYDDLIAVLGGTFSGAFSNSEITKVKTKAFSGLSGLTSVSLPNAVILEQRVFESCNNCTIFNLPNMTTLGMWGLYGNGNGTTGIYLPKLTEFLNGAMENSKFITIVAPLVTKLGPSSFSGCSPTTAIDLRSVEIIIQNAFKNTTALTTIILGKNTVATLENVNAFSGSKFDTGGAGGTIYIPKSLYDHLGDGTALDYKSATNWSVIDGYGTITWAQIEGSYYETHYADGTEIPQGGTA